MTARMKAMESVAERSRDAKLRSQLDDELEVLRRPGAADKLRRAFEVTPESIAKAATNARRRKR